MGLAALSYGRYCDVRHDNNSRSNLERAGYEKALPHRRICRSEKSNHRTSERTGEYIDQGHYIIWA